MPPLRGFKPKEKLLGRYAVYYVKTKPLPYPVYSVRVRRKRYKEASKHLGFVRAFQREGVKTRSWEAYTPGSSETPLPFKSSRRAATELLIAHAIGKRIIKR